MMVVIPGHYSEVKRNISIFKPIILFQITLTVMETLIKAHSYFFTPKSPRGDFLIL